MTWLIGNNTKLTVEGDYQKARLNFFEPGLPASGTVQPNPNGEIKRDRFLGEPDLDRAIRTLGRIGYSFEHRFSNNWSLRNAFRASFADWIPQATTFPTGLQNNRTLTRQY
ncbi:hypothetical protein F7734_14035 [Scytonema sp. UIC 10036]|uniref:hypothetical protein n=1 Tax=Scytonema sp. UIC 10036 TaxID=2304196 RepID=UPI0012DA16A3|nr:hypothetical protein [Scytonema sp. UIC 10036]MUG93487.1 hypothetical protein [Scytonema sp. UIC 10036]